MQFDLLCVSLTGRLYSSIHMSSFLHLQDYIPRTVFLGIYILGLLILVGITLGLFNYTPQRTPIEKLPGFVGFV